MAACVSCKTSTQATNDPSAKKKIICKINSLSLHAFHAVNDL